MNLCVEWAWKGSVGRGAGVSKMQWKWEREKYK
jgi:hypothetical protein